ncbi:peptidoglycan-binding protein [Paenibacillus apiarius]|uniref:Peptidoglycan-binding protein n=1 Tax=Paenibacillus apiarius TaxID=46240 RepID=A0ABT4DVN1_9BACL|nr:peptidoglycan-binding protein [Paenibacillus apiarius]MCY9513229.1 peptidoglycan-binding protein [Paenibacillus apiarius]MCY9521412.1 peptidoglycan-binding protein [Paenibacillus apiarius]MCY9554442.1 peptidoglycan-binding protein [Paenibacillus apiarius]MCY9560645.1 peptidoglycan-binding protein [Paenibacillus apiarius]MCY9685104.1 peptidoglycan-binding protein [Paenibacillus apiarius]
MIHYNLYTRQTTGTLMVFVFEGNKAKPIIGATVTISGNSQNITLQTNESGQTQPVTLPAKEPYSNYTVNVSASGYTSVKIDGVQVVPNTTGIQEIEMTPTGQRWDYRPIEEHTIPPHKLDTPEPEKPIENPLTKQEPQPRPDGPAIGLLIPEYIIVHDGAPKDRSAPNYRVKFTDYITKVACGEIYSNWHKEALTANILCITSFTLNRLYTQEYQGFDITSKIQFDHKFDPKQTVYAEIVEVVDTVFNQYVKHPDPELKQPFLTEYRSYERRCTLGQYKSQELARAGYKHLDILKYFYEPCYKPIATATSPGVIFQGRPTPPPEKVLQEGATGSDVREIQVYLNEISKKYREIPSLEVDGTYGKGTKKAVESFQKIFTIPQNGIADFRTWYKITNLYYSILEYRDNYESIPHHTALPTNPSSFNPELINQHHLANQHHHHLNNHRNIPYYYNYFY